MQQIQLELDIYNLMLELQNISRNSSALLAVNGGDRLTLNTDGASTFSSSVTATAFLVHHEIENSCR
jgi:hypothetical protein